METMKIASSSGKFRRFKGKHQQLSSTLKSLSRAFSYEFYKLFQKL